MSTINISDNLLETVRKTIKRIETLTNIQFYLSPIPEEIELRTNEIKSLNGHFISFITFSNVSAVRFNFRTGLNSRRRHLIHSCDVWLRENTLNKPKYTVLMNPNAKAEISGGVRTIADLLLGKKTMLEQESKTRFLPKIIQEKLQNDINEFIDSVGIDNIKSNTLPKIYSMYSSWADADDKRIIPKPQFYRVFKDFLIKKKIVSDTISTGHVYEGAKYEFKTNPEEEKIFNEDIIRNKTYYKARLLEVMLARLAQGDPEINGMFICGQIKNELQITKNIIKKTNTQNKTVFFNEMYGFAGFINALYHNRVGKILIFNKSDTLFSNYNSTIRNIVKSLLSPEGGRIVRYSRPVKSQESKQKLNFLLGEAKRIQPKPNAIPDTEYNVEDIMDAEDAYYNIEDEGIPESFEFSSKVVFLTDLPNLPEDFRNIPVALELHYNKEEALSLVEAKLDDILIDFKEVNLQRKREILQFMRINKGIAKSFDYNVFYHIIMIYMSGIDSWKKWGIAQLAGKYVPI